MSGRPQDTRLGVTPGQAKRAQEAFAAQVSWQVNRHKYGEKVFVLVGMGMTLQGEVWRGSMKDDVLLEEGI